MISIIVSFFKKAELLQLRKQNVTILFHYNKHLYKLRLAIYCN